MTAVSVIVATFEQPSTLRRCLQALGRQSTNAFELLVADDGSGPETREVIRQFADKADIRVTHVWQEDRGFRKTVALNRAIAAARGDYLVFLDGDCVAHPDFVIEHVAKRVEGHYLNGSLIRLGPALSDQITSQAVADGDAFRAGWLIRKGRRLNRRYLRLALGYRTRCLLNRRTFTRLYWLGSNASCFRSDAEAVNGFDHRFGYGFEDGDFGCRLERYGVKPKTVRWTANVLHLWHERPWSDPDTLAAGKRLMTENLESGRIRALRGLDEIKAGDGAF